MIVSIRHAGTRSRMWWSVALGLVVVVVRMVAAMVTVEVVVLCGLWRT